MQPLQAAPIPGLRAGSLHSFDASMYGRVLHVHQTAHGKAGGPQRHQPPAAALGLVHRLAGRSLLSRRVAFTLL